jgi:hypothetical protein
MIYPNSLKSTYKTMYLYYEMGLNPTLVITIVPREVIENDEYKQKLEYVERDSTGENGDVNTSIAIQAWYSGSIKEDKTSILRSLKLTSQGYSNAFYFTQLLTNFNSLYSEFFNNTTGIYDIDILIYADIKSTSFSNLISDYNEQSAVFAVRTKKRAGTDSCSGSCNTLLCSNITSEDVCGASNQSGLHGFSCYWTSGICTINEDCSC